MTRSVFIENELFICDVCIACRPIDRLSCVRIYYLIHIIFILTAGKSAKLFRTIFFPFWVVGMVMAMACHFFHSLCILSRSEFCEFFSSPYLAVGALKRTYVSRHTRSNINTWQQSRARRDLNAIKIGNNKIQFRKHKT